MNWIKLNWFKLALALIATLFLILYAYQSYWERKPKTYEEKLKQEIAQELCNRGEKSFCGLR